MVLTVKTTAGVTLRPTVRGVYAVPKLSPLLGAMTITTTLFDRSFTTPGNRVILVCTGGTSPAGRADVQAALQPFPTAQIHTLAGFKPMHEIAPEPEDLAASVRSASRFRDPYRVGRCEGDAARYAPSPCWLPPRDPFPHIRLGYEPGFGVRAVSPQAGRPGQNRALRIR